MGELAPAISNLVSLLGESDDEEKLRGVHALCALAAGRLPHLGGLSRPPRSVAVDCTPRPTFSNTGAQYEGYKSLQSVGTPGVLDGFPKRSPLGAGRWW